MSKDPINGDEDKENQNDWRKRCEQTGECHASRVAAVDQPDQAYTYNKKQYERT
jgi:hypothetical protein